MGSQIRSRLWRAAGLVSAASAVGVFAFSGPALAAVRVIFDTPVKSHSGTSYNYYDIARNGNAVNPDGSRVIIGKVFMKSNPANAPLKHQIQVCDWQSDGIATYMRVYPTGGGYIDYKDDTINNSGCYTRTLGYSISHYRMLMNGTLGPAVVAPPE